MKLPFDKKYFGLGVTLFSVIASSILFYLILQNFPTIAGWFKLVWEVLSPILWGLAIAYILCPVMIFFENKCFLPLLSKTERIKKKQKLARVLSLFTTLLAAVGVVTALIWLVIPQLVNSIATMIQNVPSYIKTIETFFDDLLKENPELLVSVNTMIEQIGPSAEKLLPEISNMLPKVGELAGNMALGVFGMVGGVIDLFVGLVVSIYVLYSKELFATQIKRMFYALFSPRFNRRFFDAVKTTHRTFGGFISGKLLDSAIIGMLCFIFCAIVRMPYAPLVSVLVGVTNIIPFFGPFFGAVPSAFIILLESPLMALVFVIFIVILQQIDGNIIGPKILGDSTGLSAFWVIFAILIGGGLFGVAGMFVGVPTFAVVYTFAASAIKRRLKEKKMPTDPASYSGSTEEIEEILKNSEK